MHKFMVSAFVAALVVSSFAFSPAARAASVEQVVAACDKMAEANPGSCNYVATDNGLGGCTKNGCFYCPADGSRQCHATLVKGKTSIVHVGPLKMACNRQDEGWCSK